MNEADEEAQTVKLQEIVEEELEKGKSMVQKDCI